MYLPSNTPIMQDAQDCAIADAQASLARMLCIQTKIARGRAEIFRTIISPAQVAAQFGSQPAVSAAKMQQQTLGARTSAWLYGDGSGAPAGTPGAAPQVMLTSPQVYPLNRGGGCLPSGQLPLQKQAAVATPTVLPQAPVDVHLPGIPGPGAAVSTAAPPHWSNLCWALRNGAVDQSQFTPSEFAALQYRCTQQGYHGACVPPPNTQAYLTAGRAAGNLPHIPVGPEVLAAIPQAPDQQMDCGQSYVMAGLTGYAPPWSDAFVTENAVQNNQGGVMGWIQSHLWLSLAVVGAGVLVASGKGRR